MTIAMPDPALHRMSDPLTRRRAAIMLAALFALGWMVVWLFSEPTRPYSQTELRHLSGVPYAPPQIERRIAPPAGDQDELKQQIDQFEGILRGQTVQPSPSATR
ncbi:MAG: hypothetical protein WAT66_01310 [Actinomycetota bacterium]